VPTVRPAVEADLAALTEIYNHYVLHTAITFDVHPFTPEARRPWFEAHASNGRHRLIVAEDAGVVVGYASTSRWRPKPAYDTTVESTVYCRHDATSRGIGMLLYRSLFALLEHEDVHQVVAGIALPNDPSVRLHERAGFTRVGVFAQVGRKFDRFWDVAWFERPVRAAKESGAGA
jgi:phosphinothricin acetyltransferase